MGLGNFVAGFQGGMEATQSARANRQLEKIRDSGIRRSENQEAQQAEDWGAIGRDASELSDFQLEDPFWERFSSWMTGRRSRRPAASALGGEMAAAEPTLAEGEGEGFLYADGGKITEEDKIRQRAAQNRARSPGSVQNQTQTVEGADRSVRPSRTALPEGAGRMRRALNSGTAKLGAAGALGAAALDVARTPTEDYRTRFGMETDDPSLAGDLGVRALGAASDVGNALTLGGASRFFRDKQQAVPRRALPASTPAAPSTAPAGSPAGMPAGVGAAMSSRASASGGGAQRALPAPAAEQQMDFSDVQPEEVPDFKATDWADYRAKAMASLIRGKGMSYPEAFDAVDQQVTTMQQRGFTNFAKQALALQQAGNLRGAAAAYRAAYQYFPSGRDVKFGIKGNQIVGLAVDEATGKRTGNPMLMSPEAVYAIVDNFQKPEAWQTWAKDRRESQLALKKYEETEKPLAEAQGSALLTNARASATRAQADLIGAQSGGSGGGMKPADFDRAGNFFVEASKEFAFENEVDSAGAERLASTMSEIYRRRPDMDPRVIVQQVLERARSQ